MLIEIDVMTDEKKIQRIPVMMSPADVAEIDAYRREQNDLPSRSEAIRRLIARGIEAWKQGKEVSEKRRR